MNAYHDLNPSQKKNLLEFLTSFENPLFPTTVTEMDRVYGGHAYAEWAIQKGFTPAYRLLEMVWFGETDVRSADDKTLSKDNHPLVWQPLCEANAEMFGTACNAAFQNSPNGGVLDADAVVDLIRKNADHPMLMQLGYRDGTPAVTLQLEVRSGPDRTTGIIDGLAVRPDFQGRGLGRAGLLHAIVTLREAGADKITLTVMDSNLPAVNLYQNNSFKTTRVLSSWFSWRLEQKHPVMQTSDLSAE